MKTIQYSTLSTTTVTPVLPVTRLLDNPLYKLVINTIYALAIAIIFTTLYIVLASI